MRGCCLPNKRLLQISFSRDLHPHREPHRILIATRNSSLSTRDSTSLERAFLTAANHDNCPKIHAMTKRYSKGPILLSHIEMKSRVLMPPDHGNLLFVSRDTFSKTQMSCGGDDGNIDVSCRLDASRSIFRDFCVNWFECLPGETQLLSVIFVSRRFSPDCNSSSHSI